MLRLIKTTADAAVKHGLWCGVCGEMAGDPVYAPLLLGLGVDSLSMAFAQAELAGYLFGRFKVVAEHRFFEVRRAHVLARVHVDDRQRLGALDDDGPTGRQPDLAVEGLVDLLVDPEPLEQR